jgi:hypothetical protein
MKTNFFQQHFLIRESEVEYYEHSYKLFLCLTGYEWESSLQIMQVPTEFIFINGVERFGGMKGAMY